MTINDAARVAEDRAEWMEILPTFIIMEDGTRRRI